MKSLLPQPGGFEGVVLLLELLIASELASFFTNWWERPATGPTISRVVALRLRRESM